MNGFLCLFSTTSTAWSSRWVSTSCEHGERLSCHGTEDIFIRYIYWTPTYLTCLTRQVSAFEGRGKTI